MLTVVTPPRSTALIALATVKTLLGIEGSTQDAILNYFISAASSKIVEHLGFSLGRQSVRETLSGQGRTRLLLGMAPVEPESLSIEISDEQVTDYTLHATTGLLHRENGWEAGDQGMVGEDREENIEAAYRGGYLLPGDVSDWTTATAYTVGAFVRSSSPTVLRFECTVAGTSHSSTQPTWPTVAGQTVSDNGITWTARTAWDLPALITDYAFVEVVRRYQTRQFPAGLASLEADSFSASFFATQTDVGLARNVTDGLAEFRAGRGGIA